MHTAASARPTQDPAPFAADLPPVPAPITAPIDPADVHDAEVALLRSIVEVQREALRAVWAEVDVNGDQALSTTSRLPPPVVAQVVSALVDSELAR